jgi:hypothetical protein
MLVTLVDLLRGSTSGVDVEDIESVMGGDETGGIDEDVVFGLGDIGEEDEGIVFGSGGIGELDEV